MAGAGTHEPTLAERNRGRSSDRMERVTVRMPDELIEAAQAAADSGEYANRSAAIRDAVAKQLIEEQS